MSTPEQPSQTLTAYYIVPDVEAYLDFLQAALQADVVESLAGSAGKITHAQVRIGHSDLMMGRAREDWKPSGSMQYVYVDDVDLAYERLLAAGATSVQEPEDQYYGHRTAAGRDPVGNVWWLAKRQEDLSTEELQRRTEENR